MSTARRGSAWSTGTDLLYADATPVEPKAPARGVWQGCALPPVHTCAPAPVQRTEPAVYWSIQAPAEAGWSGYEPDTQQERWEWMWGHS